MRKPTLISVSFHLAVAFGLIAASMADTVTPPAEPTFAVVAIAPMAAGDMGGDDTEPTGASAPSSSKSAAEPAAEAAEAEMSPPPASENPVRVPRTVPDATAVPEPIAVPDPEAVQEAAAVPDAARDTAEPEPVSQAEPIATEPVEAPDPKPETPVEVAFEPKPAPVELSVTQDAPTEPVEPTMATEAQTQPEAVVAPATETESDAAGSADGTESASDTESRNTGTLLAALPGTGADDSGADDGGGLGGDPAIAPGGGAPDNGALEDYMRLLGDWLDRHKEYPDRARKRNQQGIVLCEFTLAANGAVLSHRILESSGFPLLDEEVEALFQRASPLPAPPAGAELTYTVPIVFALN